jgi:CheY-like chemotaxis protein
MHHILLVDDDNEVRELLTEMLESAGFAVETARNGVEALDALRRRRPTLVILDLMMPVMDGWQLRARMLEDEPLANIPVIVMSGAGDLCERSEALSARELYAKPVAWPTLLEALRRHC